MKINPDTIYKTKDVAKRLEISKPVLRYKIRTGKIRANNVNEDGKQPCWRIKGEWIIEYEKRYGRG